jgi:hypothetical protein
MARFYVLSGPDLGHNAQLQSGQTIGRSESCALVLHDNSVSRTHARLEQRGERWFLVDAGSRNGITVAGLRQSQLELCDGLELKLGEVELRVRLAPAAARAPAPLVEEEVEEEIELEPEPQASAKPAPPPAPARPAAPAPPPAPARPAALSPAAARASAPKRVAVGGVEAKDRGILQYHKVANRGGLMHSDLAQAPWYTRLGLLIGVLLASAALAFFAFKATSLLKSKAAGPPMTEEGSEEPR